MVKRTRRWAGRSISVTTAVSKSAPPMKDLPGADATERPLPCGRGRSSVPGRGDARLVYFAVTARFAASVPA